MYVLLPGACMSGHIHGLVSGRTCHILAWPDLVLLDENCLIYYHIIMDSLWF
jgi:hypothetical protein